MTASQVKVTSEARRRLLGAGALVTAGVALPGLHGAASAQTRSLKLLSGYAPNIPFSRDIINVYMDRVQKASGGQLGMRLSGPEVVPFTDQFQPVAAGAFDMLFTHAAYHSGTTAVGLAMDAVAPDPALRRSSGLLDFVDAHYRQFGLKVIAIAATGTQGYQYVSKQPIKGAQGLRGMKVRGTVSYHPMIRALGGSPVVLGAGDVSSALEKGVIDAAAWGSTGIVDFKWYEVAKYVMRPMFGSGNTFLLMNLKAWNALPKAHQEVLTAQAVQLETETIARFDQLIQEELVELKKRGMQETRFDAADVPQLEAWWADGLWELAKAKNGAVADQMRSLVKAAGLAR